MAGVLLVVAADRDRRLRRVAGVGSDLLGRLISWPAVAGAYKLTLQVRPHNEPAFASTRSSTREGIGAAAGDGGAVRCGTAS